MLMLDDDRARIQKLKVSMEERLARVNEDLTYKYCSPLPSHASAPHMMHSLTLAPLSSLPPYSGKRHAKMWR